METWRTPGKKSDKNLLDGVKELIMKDLSNVKTMRCKGGARFPWGLTLVIYLRLASVNKLTAYQ